MKEVRAPLPEQVHRLLKEEAARKVLPLKELVAKILEKHVKQETEKVKASTNSNPK